jgi:Putative threonine/serine exporter
VVTYGTVSLSVLATVEAEATTAIQAVRAWQPNFSQLAASAALVTAIRDGDVNLAAAEAEIERIVNAPHAYPRWLRFAAPALLSFAVTIMFGGNLGGWCSTECRREGGCGRVLVAFGGGRRVSGAGAGPVGSTSVGMWLTVLGGRRRLAAPTCSWMT